MASKTDFSTILIIDQKKGRTKSLNIRTRYIRKFKYYLLGLALLFITLIAATVLLIKKISQAQQERQNLVQKIGVLNSQLSQITGQLEAVSGDSAKTRNYIQNIESKLERINEYLKKRGVRGFTHISVGGDDRTEEQSGENYALFAEYLEQVFRGLAYTPTGFPSNPFITSTFGYRNDPFSRGRTVFHSGLDFKGNKGDRVRATAHGVVVHAGWFSGYGNCVRIKHKNGYETLYGHLSKISVKKGQTIKANEVIGLIGSTGRSTGNHLHYEVRKNDKPINPRSFLSLN